MMVKKNETKDEANTPPVKKEEKINVAHINIEFQEDEKKDGKFEITLDDFNEMHRQNEGLLQIRGRIISHAIMIEKLLDNVIAALFTSDKTIHIAFKHLMLEKEFFTFFNKWRIFENLSLNNYFLDFKDDEYRKRLVTELKDIIDIRNNYAHGDIIFIKKQPHLQYMKSDKIKKDKLDNAYFDKLNEKFTFVYNSLTVVLKAIKEKPA